MLPCAVDLSARANVRSERARELYKYFRPNYSRADSEVARERDSILLSQAQLVALRLDARRCLIHFIDSTNQYCVAEGTRSLHLEEPTVHDDPEDFLTGPYEPTNVENSICNYTINIPPNTSGAPSCFEVNDLSKDARFAQMPQVQGNMKFRYYHGTPLKTKNGIVVGALCVLDDKVRPPMTPEQNKFLRAVSKNVITHLELLREKNERRRATKMSRCLQSFVDPAKQIASRRERADRRSKPAKRSVVSLTEPASSRVSPVRLQSNLTSPTGPVPNSSFSFNPHQIDVSSSTPTEQVPIQLPPPEDSTSPSPGRYVYDQQQLPVGDSESTRHEARVSDADHQNVYKHGADLLRASLDIENGGGVVFFNSVPVLDIQEDDVTPQFADVQSHDNHSASSMGNSLSEDRNLESDDFDECAENPRAVVTSTDAPAELLAASLARDSSFKIITTKSLSALRRRYPRGNLWVFDSDGNVCIDSDSETHKEDEEHSTLAPTSFERQQEEARLLRRHFPGARQIIGIPALDTRTSQWTFCFAFSTSEWRTLNYETDFLFSIAFSNCISIEKSRLATIAADQQKGDFIGSISHELRSPLHGILASCEFLKDTSLGTFQQSLVDTVQSCASTLLDTISMVLDYSKINTFDRDQRNVSSSRKSSIAAKNEEDVLQEISASQAQPSLNIFGNVDLALITEQVVEGVHSGHVFQDSSTFQLVEDNRSIDAETSSHPPSPEVELMVDIEPDNWSFVTQPGAFRRIVMNIVGNALKYTKSGHIIVRLERVVRPTKNSPRGSVSGDPDTSPAQTQEANKNTAIVRLIVTDTGVGISPEYLRNKLFEPFCQEDHLSPGIGLGLSLVRSIIKMLRGQIEVTSKLGSGTTVTVTLPVERQTSQTEAIPSASGSTNNLPRCHTDHEDVVALQKEARNCRIVTFSQHQDTKTNTSVRPLLDFIGTYISRWFDLPSGSWVPGCEADMVIADESDIETLLEAMSAIEKRPCLVILCSNQNRHAKLSRYAKAGIIEFVSKPVGPFKLARALRAYLSRTSARGTPDPVEARKSLDALVRSPSLELRESEDTVKDLVSRPRSFKEPYALAGGSQDLASLHRPYLPTRKTIIATQEELPELEDQQTPLTTSMSCTGAKIAFPSESSPVLNDEKREPSLLLVDDNAINLRLLETYAKKRKYTSISLATNGLQAVERFEASLRNGAAPDIVFMDLSMPIMGGLEATRRIREIEAAHRAGYLAGEYMEKSVQVDGDINPALAAAARKYTPMDSGAPTSFRSLIVALTGLASGKDQAEAFGSGVDLYMTKPVTFSALGKLLDNWERGVLSSSGAGTGNGGRSRRGTATALISATGSA